MTRVRLTIPALLAVALAACSSARYTLDDYYANLPDLVRFSNTDARQNSGGEAPTGPVWIDVKSFAGGGWQLTGETLSRDSVMARIGNLRLMDPYSTPYDFFSGHKQTVNFLFGDGSVRNLSTGVSPVTLRALATRAGGEVFDSSEF